MNAIKEENFYDIVWFVKLSFTTNTERIKAKISFFFFTIGSKVSLEFRIGTRSRADFLRRRMQKRVFYVHRIRDRMQRSLLKCGHFVVSYVKQWFLDGSDRSLLKQHCPTKKYFIRPTFLAYRQQGSIGCEECIAESATWG